MKRKFLFLAVVVCTALFSSCVDASRAKIFGLGDKFKIELVNCDGSVTHSWVSTGKVKSEANSDGYYFMDEKTNKLVEVCGTIVITQL